MTALARFTANRMDVDVFQVWDDFKDAQTDLTWVDVVSDAGTALTGDAANGIMTLTPGDSVVADNDEAYLRSANELFIFADGRPMYARARIRYTEVVAGVPSVFFGFMSAIAADSIIDTTGLIRASGNIACIYKVDGGSVWRCTTRDNAGVEDSVSTTAAVGATWYVLEIFGTDWDGVNMQFTYKVDGQFLKDSNGIVIKHQAQIASATEMHIGAGIKLGGATNNDTLLIDYIYAEQLREAQN